jgi:carbamoyltransferase
MEFGPRALGARSILGDARSPKMQKRDEPEDQVPRVVPAVRAGVLREDVDKYFEIAPQHDSPYMLMVAPVRRGRSRKMTAEEDGCSASTS